MNKITKYLKLVPLLLLGVAVIVWASVFQRSVKEGEEGGRTLKGDEPPVFPY